MGHYIPLGITGDAIKMDQRLRELKGMRDYLIKHPSEKEIEGKTLEQIEENIKTIKDFEFLP